MYVVDRDGLDGMLAAPSDSAVPLAPAGPARGVAATSGLFALASAASAASSASEAARAAGGGRARAPVAEASAGSWSALAPLALVPDEADGNTRVDLFPPDHVRAAGRPARVTLPAPMIDESTPDGPPIDLRPRRSVRGLVLAVGAVAAAAALIAALAPQLGGGDRDARARVWKAERPTPRAVAAAAAEPRPSAATPGPPAPRRPPSLPSAASLPPAQPRWALPTLPDGAMLEWRLPAHFAVGGTQPEQLQDAALRALVATLISRCQPETIELVGHTCPLGGDSTNKTIGKRRAREARDLLIAHGLPERKARTRSAGPTRPETENETAPGRDRNRRVTIHCQPKRREPRGVR